MKVKPMKNDNNQGQKINIAVTYIVDDSSTITLPNGRTFADIEHWHIKMDVFHCKFKDGEDFEKDLFTHNMCLDWEYPNTIRISSVQDDDFTLDEILAEK